MNHFAYLYPDEYREATTPAEGDVALDRCWNCGTVGSCIYVALGGALGVRPLCTDCEREARDYVRADDDDARGAEAWAEEATWPEPPEPIQRGDHHASGY